MAFCPNCKATMPMMAVRCETCNDEGLESNLDHFSHTVELAASNTIGDYTLLAGAVSCGGLGLYASVFSLSALYSGELVIGLMSGPVALSILAAMCVSFWRASSK